MDDNKNTLAGWILAGGIAALGLSIVANKYYHTERPEKMGYAIEGVATSGSGGNASGPPLALLLQTADLAKGKAVFGKCAACHTDTQGGPNGIGPNLYKTVGEPIGQGKNGYAFSDALKSKGGNWTFDNMNEWLTSPRKFAPGTKMTFAGLSDPADRANIIAYLNSLGSNLPLPPVPAAGGAAPVQGGSNAPANAGNAKLGQGNPAEPTATQAQSGAVGASGPNAPRAGVTARSRSANPQ